MENRELESLRRQVQSLSQRVEQLERRLEQAPASPRPSRSQPPTRLPEPHPQRESLEQRIGGTWFLRIGVIALIFSLAFFLKYAFDNDWINQYGRVAIGFLAGALLLGCGEYFRRKRNMPRFGIGLSGAGVAAFYVTIVVSHLSYGLVSSLPAYALMVAVTVLAVAMALWNNSATIAALAMLGGYLTPLLVGEDGTYVGLYIYVIILNLGTLALMTRKRWEGLLFISLIFTYILFMVRMNIGLDETTRLPFMLFLSLFHLIFLAGVLLVNLLHRRDSASTPTTVCAVLSSVLYTALAAGIITEFTAMNNHILAWVLVGWGGLCLAQFFALRFWRNQDHRLANVMLILSVAYVTVAIPVGLVSGWITAAWMILALALAALGLRLENTGTRVWGILILGLAYFRLVFFDLKLFAFLEKVEYTAPWMERLPLSVLVIGGTLVLAWLFSTSHITRRGEKQLAGVLIGLANLVLLLGVLKEFSRYYYWRGGDNANYPWVDFRNTAHSITMGLHGLVLVGVGIAWHHRLVRLFGLALLALTVGKVVLVDLTGLEIIWRVLVFFGIGLILIVASYLYQRYMNQEKAA